MAILDFDKLPAAGHITVLWALPNAFADAAAPTATELNALLNMSKAISWNDFDAGVQASNTIDDPSLADIGNVVDRGAAQYGGGISFYYPAAFDDISNVYSNVFDAISVPRTSGFLIIRVDGNKPTTQTFAEGDYIHIMDVLTDAQANVITGEEAFRYTVNFLQQGFLSVYAVVQGAVDSAVVVTPSTLASAVGDHDRLNATVAAREYTGGVVWTTSDATKATVSSAGVVTGVAVGTATITGTYAATGATDTCAVTVA